MEQIKKLFRHRWSWVVLGFASVGVVILLAVSLGDQFTNKGRLENVQLTYSGYSGDGAVSANKKDVAAVRQYLAEELVAKRKEKPQLKKRIMSSASLQEEYLYSRLKSTFDSEELYEKNILMQYPVEIRPATGLKNGDKVTLRLAISQSDADKYHLDRKVVTQTVHGLKEPSTVSAATLKRRIKVSFTGFNGEGVMIAQSKRYGGVGGKKMRFTLPQNGHLKNGQMIKVRLSDDYREDQLKRGHAFGDNLTYRVHGLQKKQNISNIKGIQEAIDVYADNDVSLNGATWVHRQRLSVYLMPFAFGNEADMFSPDKIREEAETVYVAKPNGGLSVPSSALTLLGLYRVTNTDGTTALRAFARTEMVIRSGGLVDVRNNPDGNFKELIYDLSPYSQTQVQAVLDKYGRKLE